MSPEAAIAMLDRKLDEAGQPVQLRRLTGTSAATQTYIECQARAFVRRYQPDELVGAQIQGDAMAVLSPTDLTRALWPGAAPPGYVGDWSMPRQGDVLITQDGRRQIMAAQIIRMAGQVVRIELGLKG